MRREDERRFAAGDGDTQPHRACGPSGDPNWWDMLRLAMRVWRRTEETQASCNATQEHRFLPLRPLVWEVLSCFTLLSCLSYGGTTVINQVSCSPTALQTSELLGGSGELASGQRAELTLGA